MSIPFVKSNPFVLLLLGGNDNFELSARMENVLEALTYMLST